MSTFHDFTFSVYIPVFGKADPGVRTSYHKVTRTVHNHQLATVLDYAYLGHKRLGIPEATPDTLVVVDEIVSFGGTTVVDPENVVVMLFSLDEDGLLPVNVSRSAKHYIDSYETSTVAEF